MSENVGRPTKYDTDYVEQCYKLCLLGATDEDLADFFDVATSTLYLWVKEHEEFSEARKRGKEIADAGVADRLYQRAMGYEHDAVKIMQSDGSSYEHPYRKRYPPDTAAAIYWLNNRQRGRWSNRHLHEVSGPDGGPIETRTVRLPAVEEDHEVWLERFSGAKASGNGHP